MIIWFLTACGPEPTATLFADITDQDGNIISNPSIQVYDAKGDPYGDLIYGDSLGIFTADLPVEDTFYLVIKADGYETHSFTGKSGIGEITTETGALWLRTPEIADAVRTQFSACPTTEGSFVDGQARVYLDGFDDLPVTITTATITVINGSEEYSACYMPEIDPETGAETEAERTGESGEFAIFGLEPGLQQISLMTNMSGLQTEPYSYNIFVPEDGSVPKYPLLVPMPQ